MEDEPCATCPLSVTCMSYVADSRTNVMRRMRANGWTVEGIAHVYKVTSAVVEMFLKRELPDHCIPA